MEPTLTVGKRVTVDTDAYRSAPPKVGDIVVFHPPQGALSSSLTCGNGGQGAGSQKACDLPGGGEAQLKYIKRVVAGPGDVISITNGHVVRNGKPEPDAYIRPCTGSDLCSFPQPITVPPGDWYMLGDNRGQSADSRFWGPVPTSWIIGRVTTG